MFSCTKILKALRLFRFSNAHHKPTPTRLQRVDENIIWLNIKNSYGEYERVPAFEGESLTDALVRSNVEGCRADCMGRGEQIPLHERPGDPYSYGPGCRTCMVAIREPWKQQIQKQLGRTQYTEKNYMSASDVQDADMRLACYIPIKSWMKDMNVIVLENVDDDQY